MELVINIDNETYSSVQSLIELNTEKRNFKGIIGKCLNAVKNGVVLPKGHGRLIDADVFEKRLMDARSYYLGDKADDFDLRFAAGLKSATERLVDAPTVIEADKGENNLPLCEEVIHGDFLGVMDKEQSNEIHSNNKHR